MEDSRFIEQVSINSTRLLCLERQVEELSEGVKIAQHELTVINHQIKAGKLLFKSSAVVFIAVLAAEFAFMIYLNSRQESVKESLGEKVRTEINRKVNPNR